MGLSGALSGIVLHWEMFLVFGFVHNIDNEPMCESLTRSDGSSFSFANKKTDKVSICDTDKIYLLCVVINESVTIKITRGKAWQAKPRSVTVWCVHFLGSQTVDADGEVRPVGGSDSVSMRSALWGSEL